MDMKTYISGIPTGGIIAWSGAIVDIPAGFVLCNGSNSTPDLRNNFVVGAGDNYAVDGSGGATTHTHTFSDGGHSHAISGGGEISGGAPQDYGAGTDTNTASGTTGAGSTIPPYYALAYIMKT